MRKRIILLILIVLNLGTIFFFSHQPSSSSAILSNAVSHQVEVRTPNYEQKTQDDKNIFHANMQSVVRKIAHIVLFSALGLLVLLFCTTFPIRWYCAVLLTLIFGFLCALGDEFHQSFVPGRTAQYNLPFLTDGELPE